MVNKNRCVVIGGGVISDYSKTKLNINDQDFIICADKGYLHSKEMNLNADLIIGDFDSSPYPENVDCKVIKLTPEKDETDLFLAVSEGYQLGYREFLLLGCLGGRFDHTFANLTLLAYWMDKGARIVLRDEQNEIRLLNPGIYSFAKISKYASFFAYSSEVSALTLDGFKYPLNNYTLSNSCGLCVSNEIICDKCTVSFDSGRLLTIFSTD